MAVKTKAKKTMEDVYPEIYQFARNVETQIREEKHDMDEIADVLGISRTTLWRRLSKTPYEFTLAEEAILCEFFGVDRETMRKKPLTGKKPLAGGANA